MTPCEIQSSNSATTLKPKPGLAHGPHNTFVVVGILCLPVVTSIRLVLKMPLKPRDHGIPNPERRRNVLLGSAI